MKISVVGIGKAGTLIAKFFHSRGYTVSHLINRTPERAFKLAREIPGCKAGDFSLFSELEGVVFIATIDSVIREVFQKLWKVNKKVEYFIHLSGSVSSDVFKEAAEAGKGVASFHPNLSISSFSLSPNVLNKVIFGIEGNQKGISFLTSLTEKEGLRYVNIATEGKLIYHAAAVFASNFSQFIIKVASDLYVEKLRFDETVVRELLKMYLNGLLVKLNAGTLNEFSGPAARNDTETIEREKKALVEISPHLSRLYEELTEMIWCLRGDEFEH
ncbi:Rossmann-like and DUF2520 domain-containing protein [Kosmotoga pacifica]|uniref:DUF2520 domain-containing protein n=1 Tax=Kosmotoga pacifica TaxID=1330330 RepID=A0A0G2Z6M4_9BACT|nr:DUF2520 domain-containing protein [Kosmotoga pacifica]AKI97212.1 hypothetical protein IX53_04610 [Kosmotoga pacifica]